MRRCGGCNRTITDRVYWYSMQTFPHCRKVGKGLCMTCQKKEREKTYPKKLAQWVNYCV